MVFFSAGGKDEGREELQLKGTVNSPDTILPFTMVGSGSPL